MTKDYEARARALVGTRFRPQGRTSEGLDCVGVVLATYGIDPGEISRDYHLRGDYRSAIKAEALPYFRKIARSKAAPGDLLLLEVAKEQLHFAVRTSHGLVHAHMGLRRVTETPGPPTWRVLAAYRRRVRRRIA